MTQEQIVQLSRIYNTLLNVHTCGEDSFTMTDCMRALYQIINEGQQAAAKGETKD